MIILVVIRGISEIFARMDFNDYGDNLTLIEIILISTIGGTLLGLIVLYFGSILIKWTGKPLGGQGTLSEIRTVIAWSNAPILVLFVLWVTMIVIFGKDLFISNSILLDTSSFHAIMYKFFFIVKFFLLIYSFVIFFKMLSEIQRLSIARTMVNMIFTGFVLYLLSWSLIIATVHFYNN